MDPGRDAGERGAEGGLGPGAAGYVSFEDHACGGQPFDCGRGDERIAVTCEVIGAEGIGEEDDDVGPIRRRFAGEGRAGFGVGGGAGERSQPASSAPATVKAAAANQSRRISDRLPS
jgi:hypothetical protein